MYLKRLELSGFKTFADDTDFEFAPGISAVVGPNGVGKSNIADAVMWVLGEQSMKALRSPSSQDVIFAGTTDRRPKGMAEVSLTIDNSSGALPVDYSEVTITRRLFRDGDSEYLLNKSRCRLRDVTDLFMDTGIGRHAYSIVTQGEIDAILSIRSEDRRELIEEVAGIQKYRHRRRETTRRLEQTQGNIDRLSDLVAELERQREPLEGEAEQARQYKELAERLHEIELDLFAERYGERRQRLGRLTNELAVAQADIGSAEADVAQHDEEAGKLRETLDQLERELSELRRKAAAAQADLERARATQAVGAERIRAMGDQRAALERLIATRTETKTQLEERLAQQAEVGTSLRAQHEQATADKEQRAAVAAEAGQAADEARAAVEAAERERADLLGQLDALDRETEGLGGIREEVQGQRERLAAQRQGLAERERESQALVDERRQQFSAAESAHQEALEQIEQARDDLRAGRDSAAEHRRKTHLFEDAVGRDETRLAAVRDLEASREGYTEAVRTVLEAAEDGRLAGVHGALGDLVDVPSRYEAAVEAALADQLQWIVTDTFEQARAVLDFGAQNGLGRLTCMPLTALEHAVMPSPIAGMGREVVGSGDRLVKYDRQYRRLFEYLLGGVCVVRDLEAALANFRRWGARVKFVTLDGHALEPSGALAGGSFAAHIAAAARLRGEIQQLEATLELRRPYLEAMQRLNEAAERSIYTLEAELAEKEQGFAQTQAALAEARRDAAHAEEQLEAVAEAQREVAEEDSRLRDRLADLDRRLRQIAAEREGLAPDHAAREESVGQARARLTAAGSEAGEKQELLTVTQVAAAEAAERLRADEAIAQQIREEAQRVEAEIETAGREHEGLDEQEAELKRSLEEAAGTVEQQQAELERAAAQLEKSEQAHLQVREQAAQVEASRRRLADIAAERGTQVHRLELSIARAESDLEHIAERLADTYDLAPEEAISRMKEDLDTRALGKEAEGLRRRIRAMGPVNVGAIEEYQRVKAREDYLRDQRDDLCQGRDDLLQIIADIDAETQETFLETFEAVREQFREMFRMLFGGGDTTLCLTDEENVLESGVEIIVEPPGKRAQNLLLLSGGERALTAMALVFAMLRVKPTPFCILDEIDAPLDETNVERFASVLNDFKQRTQFVIITHNKGTMAHTDSLIGVTMSEPGVSMRLAVTLQEARDLADQELPRPVVQRELEL